MDSLNEKKIIRRVSAVDIAGNIMLVLFKFYAGVAGKSSAMVSDAVHSLADVFATFVAVLGVRLARKEPDRAHPYGHERFECLASLALGGLLTATGIGIGLSGIRTILAGGYDGLAVPTGLALAAAVVSIIAKEAMFRYTRHYARKLNSGAFMADAWHQRSDALSSVGSLIGIGGAMLGFPVLDSAASVVICLFILKVAFGIIRDAVEKLLDTSCGEAFEAELRDFIGSREGVDAVDLLRSRKFGNRVYLDVEISVNGDLPLVEAHEIARQVHDAVEQRYPDIKHIMIHENPTPREGASE